MPQWCFQLGGFELPKTELSLKSSKSKEEIRSVCYYSPEKMASIHWKHTKESDIYRLVHLSGVGGRSIFSALGLAVSCMMKKVSVSE